MRPEQKAPKPPSTALGFDFGTRKIGIAVGQTASCTATALEVLPVKNRQIPWAKISHLIEQWQPQLLVVGLPLNLDETEHEITKAARRFGNQLNGRYNLPVYWMDERLSSVEAESILRENKLGVGIDAVAAQLILESWLRLQA